MNTRPKKGRTQKEVGAPGQEGAHLETSNATKLQPVRGISNMVAVVRLRIVSHLGALFVHSIAASPKMGPFPTTAHWTVSLGTWLFLAVPHGVHCDDRGCLGRGRKLDGVTVSEHFVGTLGAVAPVPTWMHFTLRVKL